MPTYLLHVSGKTIGRESGLRPIPFATKDGLAADVAHAAMQVRAEELMTLTVRRCIQPPNGARLAVQWTGKRKAQVTVGGADGRPSVAARFTITDPSPADHQVGVTLPKEY